MKKYTEAEIRALGYTIENNIIEFLDIAVLGYDPRRIGIYMACKDAMIIARGNVEKILGFILEEIYDVLDIYNHENCARGVSIDKIKNIPCRIIIEKKPNDMGTVIGFGHFMFNTFVLTDDLLSISGDKNNAEDEYMDKYTIGCPFDESGNGQ